MLWLIETAAERRDRGIQMPKRCFTVGQKLLARDPLARLLPGWSREDSAERRAGTAEQGREHTCLCI